LTTSLLFENSWLSTWAFSHWSLGGVNEMLCLGIAILLLTAADAADARADAARRHAPVAHRVYRPESPSWLSGPEQRMAPGSYVSKEALNASENAARHGDTGHGARGCMAAADLDALLNPAYFKN